MTISRDDPLSFLNPPPIPSSSSPIAVSDADSYLLDSSQTAGSASGSFSNDGGGFLTSSGEAVSEVDFGFTRPDFRQIPLVGTVEFYERHVFLCYKNPQVWPARIEAAEFDRLPRLLSAVVNAKKAHLKKQTRLTICEGHDGTETSNGDVLIFPDMIRYRRLTHFDVETFVEEVLIKDGEWLPGTPEALRGWYIFVCCHGTRDRRCGVCGPAVLSRFKEEIESRGLQRKVSVSACSHIGGDRYAGNVIIFGPNSSKQVTGHWYGYVSPDDVPVLIEQHIRKREIVDWLWRGQMGLSEEEQIKSLELRIQLNGGSNLERSKENSAQINEINTKSCGSQESTECCQTNGSFFCCQSPLSPQANNCFDLNGESAEFAAAKKSSKQVSQNRCGKGNSSHRVYSMPTWYESWEREDTYAALAVIGAVVSVAFAYNCYKQLR